MRKYTLASGDARTKVDLRDYAATIEEAVHGIMPTATVKICESCYYVSPAPSKGEAIKIGRRICQSALAQHCVMIPKLFTSIEITDKTKEEPLDGTNQSKLHGGHHRNYPTLLTCQQAQGAEIRLTVSRPQANREQNLCRPTAVGTAVE